MRLFRHPSDARALEEKSVAKRNTREDRRRVQLMEARAQLRTGKEKRRRRDNTIAAAVGAAALVVAAVLQGTVFASNPTASEYAAAQAGLQTPTASPSATPSNGPDIPKPETAAGKTFTGDLVLNGKPVGVELDGTTAPQAAAVFSSLAQAGTYNGRQCGRLTTGDSFGVLQCGQKADGSSESGYSWGPLENTPADTKYPAGTIAVARTANNAYGNGQEFFIVYKDTTIPADSAGGYTIVGKVTSGLDVVQGIAAQGVKTGNDGAPVTAVTIDSFLVK
ncbi:peptidylprolyl isomerase [Sinomonas sp. ASV486]|uniref:peptidylprolyl isomerase n=1 Tax=Sinomonas sp. ASV486 TaxID=3051170 RepID=UPI0027DABB15|nr:peptidylprolyl isomerase [Sinomonas sp. ASV486]MDQ4491488.1 peptidylprolyl isomerase [Sinomonas sp. ASV486]